MTKFILLGTWEAHGIGYPVVVDWVVVQCANDGCYGEW